MTRQPASSLSLPRAYRDVALWLVATYGILKLADLPGHGGLKVLCGPWGCLPPLQALAASHGFWLMVIVPAVVWAGSRLSIQGLGRLGLTLATFGTAGVVATVIHSLMAWGPLTPDRPWWHPGLHAVFDVVTFVDLPLVECITIGSLCVVVACIKKRRADHANHPISSDDPIMTNNHSVEGTVEVQRDATPP